MLIGKILSNLDNARPIFIFAPMPVETFAPSLVPGISLIPDGVFLISQFK